MVNMAGCFLYDVPTSPHEADRLSILSEVVPLARREHRIISDLVTACEALLAAAPGRNRRSVDEFDGWTRSRRNLAPALAAVMAWRGYAAWAQHQQDAAS